MIIAVTGGIGAGKSAAARVLSEQLDALHCDTDQVCRELLEKGSKGWAAAKKRLRNDLFDAEDNIDRIKLRQAVFADDKLRHILEEILHPLVRDRVLNLRQKASAEGRDLVVEVPLLYEAGWQDDFDVVVAVKAGREECLRRIMTRDGGTREQAELVMNAQMAPEEKERRADFVLDNRGSLADMRNNAAEISQSLMKR